MPARSTASSASAGDPMSAKKDMLLLIEEVRRAGWDVRKTGGNHFRVQHPKTGTLIFTSSTPGDSRAVRNFRAQLKRGGLVT